jgi:GTPase Era involved in 16S rRNA processing
LPAFTTKEHVTEISGRGVGLDVVQTMLREVGGSVSVESQLGKGCTLTLKLPITRSVLKSLLVVVDSSDKHKHEQIEVVEREFERLNVDKNRVVLVYNKVDKLTDEEVKDLVNYPYDTCYIGAKSGKNVVQLKQMIRERLKNQY